MRWTRSPALVAVVAVLDVVVIVLAYLAIRHNEAPPTASNSADDGPLTREGPTIVGPLSLAVEPSGVLLRAARGSWDQRARCRPRCGSPGCTRRRWHGSRCPAWSRRSTRRASASTAPHGADQDVEVLHHRPVVDVVEVEAHGLVPAEVGAAGDLPQAGHARTHAQPAAHVGAVAARPRGAAAGAGRPGSSGRAARSTAGAARRSRAGGSACRAG